MYIEFIITTITLTKKGLSYEEQYNKVMTIVFTSSSVSPLYTNMLSWKFKTQF